MIAATHLWSIDCDVSALVGGRPLYEWVDVLHRHNCEQRAWDYSPLARGAFGFEILAASVLALDAAPRNASELELAARVHQAWARVYLYWRDKAPAAPYRLPHTALGDHARNEMAQSAFHELPAEEREKDIIVVRGFLQHRAR